ncbi:MAG: DASS family sodium-coupled anion symporter [Treponema sp.]|nr:DASS family sodium-coupled anion symporter [Treponema sp.]
MPAKEKNVKLQYLHFAIAVVIMIIVSKMPVPQSILTAGDAVLDPKGRLSLGVLFFCLYLWITEPVPFHITGCIGVLLLTFFKLDTFANIIKLGFGNDTVVFFIGVLILSSVISKSGLGKRISMAILAVTGNKTTNVILGFIVAATIIGMWITDMAVAAILMPIAKSMLENEGLKSGESNFGKGLMISIAYGALISGITTPAACGSNIIAMSFMKTMLNVNISFLQWMMYGVSAAILMIIPCWFILTKMFKPEISRLSKTREELRAEFRALGPMNRNEIATTVVFVITIALWLSSTWLNDIIGIDISSTIPALICGCLLFMPGVMTFKWKEISNDISWDNIILIATGMSLGLVMYSAGAAGWLANVLLGGIIGMHPIIQIFLIVIIISLIKVGLSSNTVTATIIMPIIAVLAQQHNMPLLGILIPTALSLSLAFILVTSTPTNVIPYSTGYFRIPDMAKAGVLMTICTSVIIALSVFGIGSLAGIY